MSGKRTNLLGLQLIGPDLQHSFPACMAAFVGTFFFFTFVGILQSFLAEDCTIDAAGACSAACDCTTVSGVPAGTYKVYNTAPLILLVIGAGAARAFAWFMMGPFSAVSLDPLIEIAQVIFSAWTDGGKVYWDKFAGVLLGQIAGTTLAVLTVVGWTDGITDLGNAQVSRHGAGDYFFRAIVAVSFYAAVRTMYVNLASMRYSLRMRDAVVQYSGYPSLEAFFHQAFGAGVIEILLGAVFGPIIGVGSWFFYTFMVGVFQLFKNAPDVGGKNVSETHYVLFLAVNLVGLGVPILLSLYIKTLQWARRGMPMARGKQQQNGPAGATPIPRAKPAP